MKIGILSDCETPTVPEGGHGLGRVAVDLAEGLKARGHSVTLYGAVGSKWSGDVVSHASETERASQIMADTVNGKFGCDVYVDVSHGHQFSKLNRFAPVINYLMDFECAFEPPNAVIANEAMRWRAPNAERVPLGIDVGRIPTTLFRKTRSNQMYAAYAAKIHKLKGPDLAMEAAALAGIPIQLVGANIAQQQINNHRERIDGPEFYEWLGNAEVHLAPYRRDAGARVALEAAACGTATITFDRTGTKHHVAHGITGWIVRDVQEMADAIGDVRVISRRQMREWVKSNHDVSVMVDGIARLIERILDGETW